jgi:Winged helix DNA-binding domain
VTERLLAVQAQDGRGARLAVRARSRGTAADDVDRELTERRSLLVTWLNRGTLHLVRAEDYPWLHALTTPPLLTGSDRRLQQEGVSPGQRRRGIEVIKRALIEEGPLTRVALRDGVQRAGVPVGGQALAHLLYRAGLEGICVRGPMIGREQAYVLARDWLDGDARPVDRAAALAELARRYLAGHGPASERDLARWAGLPLRDARAGLAAIASELVELDPGLVDLRLRRRAAPLPPPRLLGAFEPLLLGWTSRQAVLGDDPAAIVAGGMFRTFALVAGRAVASWRLGARAVEIEPFGAVSDDDLAALRRDGLAVRRFLGLGP